MNSATLKKDQKWSWVRLTFPASHTPGPSLSNRIKGRYREALLVSSLLAWASILTGNVQGDDLAPKPEPQKSTLEQTQQNVYLDLEKKVEAVLSQNTETMTPTQRTDYRKALDLVLQEIKSEESYLSKEKYPSGNRGNSHDRELTTLQRIKAKIAAKRTLID